MILFTKTRAVNKEISDIFQSHSFTKKYFAVVEDTDSQAQKLSPDQIFTVEMNMGRISSSTKAAKWGKVPEGQYSKTDFKVLRPIIIENKKCLLLECTLYTGRTHQIRVHLSSLGLPLLGDALYGGPHANRIYLHSCELTCDLFSVKSECPW